MPDIEILFEDDYLIGINKAHGDLIHASPIARNAEWNLKDELSSIRGFTCYPLHRLDRKTSGICLFSKKKEWNGAFQSLFDSLAIKKEYFSIVRGFTEDAGTINYALTNDRGKIQEAVTHYKTIKRGEIDYEYNGFPSIRYSYIKLAPETGRFHQIRKHLAHIYHPIIGDRPHGCNKQNKLWKEVFGIEEMLLHAASLTFIHPVNKTNVHLEAPYSDAFHMAYTLIFNEELKQTK